MENGDTVMLGTVPVKIKSLFRGVSEANVELPGGHMRKVAMDDLKPLYRFKYRERDHVAIGDIEASIEARIHVGDQGQAQYIIGYDDGTGHRLEKISAVLLDQFGSCHIL